MEKTELNPSLTHCKDAGDNSLVHCGQFKIQLCKLWLLLLVIIIQDLMASIASEKIPLIKKSFWLLIIKEDTLKHRTVELIIQPPSQCSPLTMFNPCLFWLITYSLSRWWYCYSRYAWMTLIIYLFMIYGLPFSLRLKAGFTVWVI